MGRKAMHMTIDKADEIRNLYFAGVTVNGQRKRLTQREIGKIYGLTQKSVSRIVCNEVWWKR